MTNPAVLPTAFPPALEPAAPIMDARQLWAVEVRQGLNALNCTQCAVLELAYFEHLSQHAIAARLGLTQERVSSHAASGMIRLAAHVEAAGRL